MGLIVWHGRGILGLLILLPFAVAYPLVFGRGEAPQCGFGVATFLIAGAVCTYCGNLWNRNGTQHSLQFIPLEVLGWLYLVMVVWISLLPIRSLKSAAVGQDEKVWIVAQMVASLLTVAAVGLALFRYARFPADPKQPQEGAVETSETVGPREEAAG